MPKKQIKELTDKQCEEWVEKENSFFEKKEPMWRDYTARVRSMSFNNSKSSFLSFLQSKGIEYNENSLIIEIK